MAELNGMRAVVAGALRPHAAGCAATLKAAGANVVLVDRNEDELASLATRLGQGVSVQAAASSAEAITAAVDALTSRLGKVDILLICAAVPVVARSVDLPPGDFAAALSDNVLFSFLWCQAVGRRMIEAGSGVIVNVTGLSGLGGWPGWAGQSASLAAVHNLTHTLATEWTRYGVRVNCLVAGAGDPEIPYLLQTPEAPDIETVLRRIPAGRLATEADLGKALIYLVRPEASFISGEILRVDGGWDAWGRYYALDPNAGRR